uniref:Uncharacterized protein n=1 Tax=Rhizophora mucronata TaxID=61149 RepID=A0A2P2PV36_RHIMU
MILLFKTITWLCMWYNVEEIMLACSYKLSEFHTC